MIASDTTSNTFLGSICKYELDGNSSNKCAKLIRSTFNYKNISIFDNNSLNTMTPKRKLILETMLDANENLSFNFQYTCIHNCMQGETVHFAIFCKDPVLKQVAIEHMGRGTHCMFMTQYVFTEIFTFPFKLLSVGIFLCSGF